MNNMHIPKPMNKRFWTPGTIICVVLIFAGFLTAVLRFIFGIGTVTNLDDQYPWGIWIAIDVGCGVALAAGGFTASALAHIFHREHYKIIVRPAILTAMLGYTFVALGLMVDLGRYYNIWHPLLPSMWQGNSVLFEVGMCVILYLLVLYIEFLPIVVERFKGKVSFSKAREKWNQPVEKLLRFLEATLSRVMFFFIIMGVVLSCLHQSSLGTLMLIANHKFHPLWNTPLLPFLFLCSAIMVGFPMVIFESMIASKSFRQKPEMHVLAPLSRIVPMIGLVYLASKIIDIFIREAYVYLFNGTLESTMWLIEVVVGVAIPVVMLLFKDVRKSPKMLFTAATLIIFGIIINRINVFLVAYTPLYATKAYFPTLGEIAVTVGLISGLIFVYRLLVNNLPIISQPVTPADIMGDV
ncbi:MAG: NrfD/PsrC family molybdoenzyme membrane anchor subunit [bacterium]